ncbi:uncharacterized protein YbjT (DUF2867 family)/uncharacterized membrane protein [Microvirga flocculans]|uniref:Uncharacterized protein YbjT (DUF2867 family)/uncharacterized membrane protein n=1 Tax=Microvirga flocculans TaxID=217168 RepID=A0A7W6IDN3_9HYPH|nr:SDR family oxidoreductase [Microvirga flocculans]MBB4039499.1 uncharacterized protein YbjT (DUF2867 family)/uncharacterized membrane protein [Microvirga flocculans]
MQVLVLGGYGLIGQPVVSRLLEAGYHVTGLGRSVRLARRICPQATWVERDISTLTRPQDWLPVLSGVDAVVNCSGALQDSPRDHLQALQTDAMQALFEACRTACIKKVVQISAVGVSRDATTPFLRTKADADEALMASDLDWIVLRPGLVIAQNAYGGTALIRALASFPLIVPLLEGSKPIQTVCIEDVVDAVLACVDGQVETRSAYDLVEAQDHSLKEIILAFRSWLGFAAVPILHVPRVVARLLFSIGDTLGYLGWRPPVRMTALRQLEVGVRGDPAAWVRARGRAPSSLPSTLARMTATIQERWFARLWLLKPIIIGTLSLFWLASGMIGFIEAKAAAAILLQRGVGEEFAMAAVFSGSLVDISLAALLLVRATHKAAAYGMIATTVAYLAAGTLLTPNLWLDPLGPFVKTIPGVVLALVVLAIADER